MERISWGKVGSPHNKDNTTLAGFFSDRVLFPPSPVTGNQKKIAYLLSGHY